MEPADRKTPKNKLAGLIARIGHEAAWEFYRSMPDGPYMVLEPWTCLVTSPTPLSSTSAWISYRDEMLRLAAARPDQPNFLILADGAAELLWWRAATPMDYRFWNE